MDIKQIRDLYDKEQRREVAYFNLRREVTPHVVRLIGPASGDSAVVYSRLTAANADTIIQEEIAYFEEIGHDFEWKLYSYDPPADLKDRLQRHGFAIGEVEAVLILDIEQASSALLQPVTPDVRRITEPEQVEAVMAVQQQVWPDKAFINRLGQNLREELLGNSGQTSIYVAYADGQPVSSARIEFQRRGQFAGLWGGSTVPEYRGRGFYTALVAARLQEARRRKVRFLTIDASPMSRPILEKVGFLFLAHTYPCLWHTTSGGTKANDS